MDVILEELKYHCVHDSEIIICNKCKGTGRKYEEECINYHKRDWETVDKGPCPRCGGYGRLKESTTKTIERLSDEPTG